MKHFVRTATLFAALLGLACSDGLGNDEARLTVLLTDAPGDVTAAVVTISAIYLQGAEGDEEEDAPSGRVYLLTEPVTTDLLTLVDDVATLVNGAVVPAGRYGQLRFVLDGAYIEVETESGSVVYATPGYAEAPDQIDGELKCPSCAQSGIKVSFAGGFDLEGENETLLVDFDVAQTFGKEAGNSGKWVMHPSLKASVVE